MPLALVALAAMLVIIGVTGNYDTAGPLVEDDIMGHPGPGFLQFMIGIIGIGAFFRLIGMPNAGRVFLILVILVYLMKDNKALTALENVSNTATSTSPSSPSAAAAPAAAGVSTTAGAPLGLAGAVSATPVGSPLPAGGSGTH